MNGVSCCVLMWYRNGGKMIFNFNNQTKVCVYENYEIIELTSESSIDEVISNTKSDIIKTEFIIDLEKEQSSSFVIVPSDLSKIKKKYNPLTEALDLYTEMAKIKLNDRRSILKFVDNFGIPIGIHSSNSQVVSELNIVSCSSENLFILDSVKTMLEIWEAIDTSNSFFLEGILAKENFRSLQINFKNYSSTIKNPNLIERSQQLLLGLIELHDVYKKCLRVDLIDGKLSNVIRFDNLFSLAMLQLAQSFTEGIGMKRCELCGSLFEVRHKGRRFCPPLLNNQRSTCENTHNQRLKRIKQINKKRS